MRCKCRKCGDIVEVTRQSEYKTCKCGAIGLDYGDGYYYRVCGNPEDFDGEIEGAPVPTRAEVPLKETRKEHSKTAEEEFKGYNRVVEEFKNVNVTLNEDGTLYIDDAESDEMLAEFKVVEK